MNLLTEKELPIGIFDSGVGGLTVLRALQQALPQEHFLYLGDTARLPYGTKSAETVKKYALNACEVLVNKGIKMLVVACNTATAMALEALQEKFAPLPVIGVILPGAHASLAVAQEGPIVVLATEGTVNGHAYRQILAQLAPNRSVIEWPCSLLVALAEEGWCEGELVEKIIHKVLEPLFASLKENKPSCLLLGCTHFPTLKMAIETVVGREITVIDPAHSVAAVVKKQLEQLTLLNSSSQNSVTRFMATDGAARFARVAATFLGFTILPEQVELISVVPAHFAEKTAVSLVHTDIILDKSLSAGSASILRKQDELG